jgi:superfamily II DNA or RNA helicase
MHKLIIHSNKKAQIETEDKLLLHKINNLLSFKQEGVEFSPAYQNGWNGITYLMNKRGIFNFPLLPRVERYLQDKNIEYIIEDRRPQNKISEPLDISEVLKNHDPPLIPREHQVRILEATNKNDIGIVRAATASGKTLATALITAKKNVETIVFVIGLDLLDQFYELYCSLFGSDKIGYIGNGIIDPKRITICSIWTAGKALSIKEDKTDEDLFLQEKECDKSSYQKIIDCLKQAKLIFIDECHICTTNTIAEINKVINPDYIYGFSGTPYRGDNSDLLINSILGEQIVNISASELIEKKILPMPIIKFITVPKMSGLSTAQYLSVYKEYIVENEVRNNLVVENVKMLLEKRYCPLVLFKQINHGNILYEKMIDAGIKCALINGNDDLDYRNEMKQRFVDGDFDALCCSIIFDIGINIPKLSAVVLAGGGRSFVRCLQRVGRAGRPLKGKTHCAIIDFYDQAKYLKTHSKIRYETYLSEPGFKVIKSKEMK